ncbi:MAG: hypothetical protein RIG62_29820 [Cyclobacteriaceae bacterium]
MRNLLYLNNNLFAAIALLLFAGCRDEDSFPLPEPEWSPVAEVQWTDENSTFYNYENLPEAQFEFTLIGEDFGYEMAEVASIDVFVSYNGREKVMVDNFDNLPATVTVPATQAASLFNLSVDDLALGDTFTFSFIVYGADGRVFTIYNNNICNLIRIAGVCTLDAYVLNPTVALTSVSETDNAFDVVTLESASDDAYVFTLDKKEFTSTVASRAEVQLMYNDGTSASDWKPLTTVNSFPAEVSVLASDAATLFDMTATDLTAGDQFEIQVVFSNEDGSFSNYGSAVCGLDFPSNIVYPQHSNVTGEIPNLSWNNPYGATTAPASTSLTGTCSLSIAVE